MERYLRLFLELLIGRKCKNMFKNAMKLFLITMIDLKSFKLYSSIDEVNEDNSVLFNLFFVEGLQGELEQQVKKVTT